MDHALVRATILPQIIEKIEEKYNVGENEALKMFYSSGVGRLFSQEDTGLYGQSPNYIYGLFEEEN
jgi:hypothetical protein